MLPPLPSKLAPSSALTFMNTPAAFDAAYYAALPLEVQAAANVTDFARRSLAMQDLADRGFIIDREILIDGWDPYKTMWARHKYGYTWVESVGHAGMIDLPPGVFGGPDRRVYDPNRPPKLSIHVPDPDVCDLAKWYPPTIKPPAQLPPPAPAPIPKGPYIGDLWPEMDTLSGRAGTRHVLSAGELLKVGYETSWGQPNNRAYVKALYMTFATAIPYFYPKVA